MGMLAEYVHLGSSRCTHRATIADSPRGQWRIPSAGAHWGPLGATPKQALNKHRTLARAP
eukprot:7329188-Alexandrium_andersonii.AAC.1